MNRLDNIAENIITSPERYGESLYKVYEKTEGVSEVVGIGGSRVICRVDCLSDDKIVKFTTQKHEKLENSSLATSGIFQNFVEKSLSETNNPLSEFILPPDSWDSDYYRYSVQTYAPEIDSRSSISSTLEKVENKGFNHEDHDILHLNNWGKYDDECRLVDFGYPFTHPNPFVRSTPVEEKIINIVEKEMKKSDVFTIQGRYPLIITLNLD